jgi:hypothetical protein
MCLKLVNQNWVQTLFNIKKIIMIRVCKNRKHISTFWSIINLKMEFFQYFVYLQPIENQIYIFEKYS